MAITVLDLRAPSVRIKFDKGKTLNPIFYYLSPDNTVINISGWTARMQARLTIDSTSIISGWEFTTENGGLSIVQGTATLLDGSTVVGAYGVKLNISPTLTTAITWTEAVFDIELIDTTTIVYPFLKGELVPENEVTR